MEEKLTHESLRSEVQQTATLPIWSCFLQMRFLSVGRLLPWLGPALRGVVAREVKSRFCRWPVREREKEWRFCKGCPHQVGCPYGMTFECDMPQGGSPSRGMEDGIRAIALAPYFPVDVRSQAGDLVQVRMMLLGQQAIRVGGEVLAAMTHAERPFVLGADDAKFVLEEQLPGPDWPEGYYELSAADLCGSPRVGPGRIPWLRLSLISPLFLKESAGRDRASEPMLAPRFGHLLRACLRTVGRAFAVLGSGPLEGVVEFSALKTAAEEVATQDARWQVFRQVRYSYRRYQQYELEGVVGEAVFKDVPAGFLPWLVWGGRLGVGDHRVAGAGCWQLTML